MLVEHAIYTSLERRGRSGYHIVSRSPGISDADLRVLTNWCPSHGSLVVDEHNRHSVNFHRLDSARFVLSRTCEGPAEYSGRGGRQLYTHLLILSKEQLSGANNQLVSLYFAARALGQLQFRPDPPAQLAPLALSGSYPQRGAAPQPIGRELAGARADLPQIARDLARGRELTLAVPGDRLHFVDELLAHLPENAILDISFATSLLPSKTRPFQLLFDPLSAACGHPSRR